MTPETPSPDLLLSDSEREPVVERLRQAFSEGRLTKDEFDQRLALALTARTHGDLAPVVAGLPSRPAAPVPARHDGAVPTAERSAAAAAHLLGAVTWVVGPLVMVIATAKDSQSFARSQAIEALNFQLSLLIITIVTLGIGGVLWAVAWIFSIVAAVNAANGHPFRYPFSIRLIR